MGLLIQDWTTGYVLEIIKHSFSYMQGVKVGWCLVDVAGYGLSKEALKNQLKDGNSFYITFGYDDTIVSSLCFFVSSAAIFCDGKTFWDAHISIPKIS